jgi:hypothetical protein
VISRKFESDHWVYWAGKHWPEYVLINNLPGYIGPYFGSLLAVIFGRLCLVMRETMPSGFEFADRGDVRTTGKMVQVTDTGCEHGPDPDFDRLAETFDHLRAHFTRNQSETSDPRNLQVARRPSRMDLEAAR